MAYERQRTIPQLFRAVAEGSPDAIALEDGERSLSYDALAARSRRLALSLQRRGVGLEVPVALMLPRSIELVVAILGVLEAGGWYAPLDPTLPADRLSFLLDDCGARMILTNGEPASIDALRAAGAGPDAVVDLASLEATGSALDNGAPAPAETGNASVPTSLAYVMYTSGSTGRPKGVAVSHRSVVRLVRHNDFIRFGPDQTYLLLAPPAFDASTLELWGPLLNGGRLVIHPEQQPSLDGLGEVIETTGVTTLWLTAGLFHQMVETQLPRLRGVRQLLAGGDVLSVEHVRRVLDACPETTLVNGYGPTENTTFTTCFAMGPGTGVDPENDLAAGIPIGRPIVNGYVRVLDPDLRPAAVGEHGELYAGGDGLARAYRGRPALTAKRFVPDPFALKAGARLYRTGDRVAWRDDGTLLFVGRLDDQVKLRGFRVEPQEIALTLLRHPAVAQAVLTVCTVRSGGIDDKRLAAYLVAEPGDDASSLTATVLARWLGTRVPDYMVPSAFLVLDTLPLNANGKVDRSALPAPSWGSGSAGDGPTSPTEAALVTLWADSLGSETVATSDNFFALGGHSLTATRLVAGVRETLAVELTLGELYAHPSVAALARYLAPRLALRLAAADDDGPVLEPVARHDAWPLSFAQRSLWFHHQLHPASGLYNLPFALDLTGTLDRDALARALGALVARHEPLRTRFPEVDDQPRQAVEPRMEGAFPIAFDDLSTHGTAERNAALVRMTETEAATPFDLMTGPVLRARLIRLDARRHRFLLTVHHIAFDGWSVEILLRELDTFYRGDALADPRLQYVDFAAWQVRRLAPDDPVGALARGLDFWRRHLDDVPTTLDLAPDRPRPTSPLLAGDTIAFHVDAASMASVRQLARDEGATPFVVLLAGYQILLHRRCRQQHFVVGTPSSGRNHPATQSMIGFFVNLTPLVADLSNGPSFRRLVRRNRDETATVLSHRAVPFDRLVDTLAPVRQASRHPIVQAVLSLETALFEAARLPGLDVERVRVTTGTAKFDLLLYAEETDDGGLDAWFEYPTDLFERATVEAMAADFCRILDQLLARPDQVIAGLESAEHETQAPAAGERQSAADPEAWPDECDTEQPGPPRGASEELVAGIFADVLGLDVPPDRADSFFLLGGHSLLATQAVARLRRAFDVTLSIAAVFEWSTVAGLARHLEDQRRGGTETGRSPLVATPGRDRSATPLSFAQERLWFLDQFHPESPVYNIPEVLALEGPIDGDALVRAVEDVVARHPVLHGCFTTIDRQPVHNTTDRTPDDETTTVSLLDLRGHSDPEGEADARTAEASTTPFDLARGPLWRALVLRLAERTYRLVWVVHHAVFDGWSLALLHRDLGNAYRARRADLAPDMPSLEIDYGDYAAWQRRVWTDDVLAPQLDACRAHLAGAPPALELPTDRPRPLRRSFRGANVRFELAPALAAAVDRAARQWSATPFMVLLAAFEVVLHQHTGQRDIVIGTPVAGRGEAALDDLIGFFVNTLALRVNLDGRPSFAELVTRVRTAALGGYDRQDLPFERLVEAIEPERDLSRSPLFQVFFAFANTPAPRLAIDGVAVQRLPPETGSAKFDLSLLLEPEGDGLAGTLEYATDLFDEATVAQFAARYERVLRAGLAAPEQIAAGLPMLGSDDRAQLDGWNATGTTREWAPRAETLHGAVAAQAAESPDAVALVWNDTTWTYGTLLRRAARLSHHLRSLGVGAEDFVGICLHRDGDLVVAVLATLFAGGTYVPLDPTYPAKRLAFMHEDTALSVVLSHRSLIDRLPATPGVRRVIVDDPTTWWGSEAAIERDIPPAISVDPGQLAYLIYTSGSTGRAKGVAIEHRQALAMVRWASGAFASDEVAGLLASTSICFDLSVFELFLPLVTGGAVLLVPNALALLDLPDAIAERITLVNTVPSVMAEVLRAGDLPASVRTVNLAGEPLPSALVEAMYARGVDRVWNLYGPSEDTTYSTGAVIPRGAVVPSIGAPIDGTRAHVLGSQGRRVPPTVGGELYLAGEGVSRGYWQRPALTAERFVPDALATVPGARAYRTGDRVCWRPDGTLRFLDRLDHQVKIRGFRVELGEIEATLSGHESVSEAVVMAPVEGDGDADDALVERRLIAWVVPNVREAAHDTAPDANRSGRLRAYLDERLPAHAVPSAIVALSSLPRLPNGKVDRKNLPLPTEGGDAAASSRAPETPLENVLAHVMAAELSCDRIGADDDFFQRGGHSLSAVRLLSRLGEELLIDDPPRVHRFFERPTVAGLASVLLARPDRARIERTAELVLEMAALDDHQIAARLQEGV